MAWTIKFWNTSPVPPAPVVTWNHGNLPAPSNVPSGQVTDLTNDIARIAALSTLATARLDAYGQDIRIGYDAGEYGASYRGPIDDYIVINRNLATTIHFINDKGEFVAADIGLTIMHELAHIYLPGDDPLMGQATPAQLNGANFDSRGPIIDEQNAIAANAGLTRQTQVSYYATLFAAQAEFNLITVNSSYSDGNSIENARVGGVNDDVIDHSLNTTRTKDLMFGFGGADSIRSGKGTDYVYGGEGSDSIWGGLDDDHLWGEKGADFVHGGEYTAPGGTAPSVEDDGVDSVNYSKEVKSVTIRIVPVAEGDQTFSTNVDFNRAIFVETKADVSSGTTGFVDTLVSIEKIVATDHKDTVYIKSLNALALAGADGKGGVSEIDLKGETPEATDTSPDGDLIDLTDMTVGVKVDLLAERVELRSDATIGLKIKDAERVTGGSADDLIYGDGEANVLVGNGGSDEFKGGAGDDVFWGDGFASGANQAGDSDTVTYAGAPGAVTVTFNGTGSSASLTASDGEGGTDTLHSIEKIIGSAHDDIFVFSGTIADGLRLRIEAGGGQGDTDEINLNGTLNTTVTVARVGDTIKLTSLIGGDGEIELVGFAQGTKLTFKGSDEEQTKFVGGGKGTTFKAGEGGGDFTLMAGDKAYGYAGVVDIFRVTTVAPTDGMDIPVDYLERNKVFLGNFGAEDLVYVNGVLFNGNRVTSSLTEQHAVDANRDYLDWHGLMLSGDSSYGTSYAQPVFEQRGWTGQIIPHPWGRYVYDDQRIRDVSYQLTDTAGIGLITFLSRSISSYPSSGNLGDYTLDALTASDEQLTIVIEGFANGEGGIVFENDELANLVRPTATDRDAGHDLIYTPVYIAWDGIRVGLLDSEGGYRPVGPGGPMIGLGNPGFNEGRIAFDGRGVDWEEFVSAPQVNAGSAGPDDLRGGWAADQLSGGDSDDILRGGRGDDVLHGGLGSDQIYGDLGNDILLGGEGADALDGGSGNDLIDGGDGVDTAYYVSREYSRVYIDLHGNVVVEGELSGEDTDTLSGVEFLHFAMDDITIATADLPFGTSGNDVLTGSGWHDGLFGGAGADSLTGLAGNDWLDGGMGGDTLEGGEGDDLYDVDDTLDVVIEAEDQGQDTVRTTLSAYTLPAHVEQLVFVGTTGFTGVGNSSDNVITGGAHDDVLLGGAGYDTFYATSGHDVIDGGSNQDAVYFRGSSRDYSVFEDTDGAVVLTRGLDVTRLYSIEALYFTEDEDSYNDFEILHLHVDGTSGPDDISDTYTNNNIYAGAGNDRISLTGGRDFVDGGDGIDTVVFGGSSDGYWVYRNPYGEGIVVAHRWGGGADFLVNVEQLEFQDAVVAFADLPPSGTAAGETMIGGFWPDYLNGFAGNDTLSGGGGPDILIGGDGDDILLGGDDDDTLYGGSGADLLDGGFGSDWLNGGDGHDTYVVDNWGDVVEEFEDGGIDTVETAAGSSVQVYQLPENVENLVGTSSGGQFVRGNALDNVITMGDGGDLINLSDGGVDTVHGGGSDDGFYFGGAMDSLDAVDGGAGSRDQLALHGVYAGLTFGAGATVNVEMIVLLAGNDTRFADLGGTLTSYNITTVDANIAAGQMLTFQGNTLRAGETFTLDGSAETNGFFLTFGGLGTENLTGGQQGDGFYFGTGRFNASDTLDGRGGSDQFALQGNFAGVNALTLGATQLTSIEFIVLLSASDTRFGGGFVGQSFSYAVTMNDGNVASGQQMTVQANGLKSGEVLTFDGSAEMDGSFRVYAGAGADVIIGSQNADELWGQGGADSIEGRGGADVLRGGAGNDLFVYRAISDSTAGARDQIMDFASGDLIDLSSLDANSVAGGQQAFQLLANGQGFTAAGQLQITQTGATAVVKGDSDGDGVADFSIHLTLTGGHTLTSADFLGLANSAEPLKLEQTDIDEVGLWHVRPDWLPELYPVPSVDLVIW